MFLALKMAFKWRMTIQNVVVSGFLNEPVDLKKSSKVIEGSIYSHKRFPGLVLRMEKPHCTFLLFQNGKFVCTGTKLELERNRAIAEFLNVLRSKGLISNGCKCKCEVQNIVALVKVESVGVDLNKFAKEFGEVTYEPERFPAATYHTVEGKVNFLVFSNGEFVCSGTSSEEKLAEAVEEFLKHLQEKGVLHVAE